MRSQGSPGRSTRWGGPRGSGLPERSRRETIEVGDGVGLRPDADLSRFPEGLVSGFDDGSSFPEDPQLVATQLEPQGVPDPRRDLAAPAAELLPAPVHDSIEPDVALQG